MNLRGRDICILLCACFTLIDMVHGQEVEVDECEGNPCKNGGVCHDGINSYTCTCKEAFNGANCDFLYWSFETLEGIYLRVGSHIIPQVPGKAGYGVGIDRFQDPWIDLGIQTGACMTQPDNCGAAGGAISMWLKVHGEDDTTGVITSMDDVGSPVFTTGFQFRCSALRCVYFLLVRDGFFLTTNGPAPPTGWFHLVFNYLGPEDGEGTRVFYNGIQVTSSLEKVEYSALEIGIQQGDGRIAIGRSLTGSDWKSGLHEVDELILFNQALTDEEIERLSSNDTNQMQSNSPIGAKVTPGSGEMPAPGSDEMSVPGSGEMSAL